MGKWRVVLISLAALLLAVPAARAAENPALSPSQTSINYGEAYVGAHPSFHMSATNTGTAALHIASVVASTGTGPSGSFTTFMEYCSGTTLQPGDSCPLEIQFNVQALGTADGTVTFNSDDPNSPAIVTTHGYGIQPPVLVADPSSVSYGTQWVGSPRFKVVTVSDSSPTDLHVQWVTISNDSSGSFSLSFEQCSGQTLSGNDTCDIFVRFHPSTTGHLTADLFIGSDDPLSPKVVPLSGDAVSAPNPTLSPAVMDFGDVAEGSTSDPQQVTVTNNGERTFFLYPWTEPPFSITCCVEYAQLDPGESITFSVTASPEDAGILAGDLHFEIADDYYVGFWQIPLSVHGVVDTTPPTSKLTTPDHSVLVAGQTAITGTITDDLSGVATETIDVASVVPGSPVPGTSLTANPTLSCSTRLSCTWSVPLPSGLLPGAYTVSAHGTDKAKNPETPTKPITIVVV